MSTDTLRLSGSASDSKDNDRKIFVAEEICFIEQAPCFEKNFLTGG